MSIEPSDLRAGQAPTIGNGGLVARRCKLDVCGRRVSRRDSGFCIDHHFMAQAVLEAAAKESGGPLLPEVISESDVAEVAKPFPPPCDSLEADRQLAEVLEDIEDETVESRVEGTECKRPLRRRSDGCLCTHEEGDSACPVHPSCSTCSELAPRHADDCDDRGSPLTREQLISEVQARCPDYLVKPAWDYMIERLFMLEHGRCWEYPPAGLIVEDVGDLQSLVGRLYNDGLREYALSRLMAARPGVCADEPRWERACRAGLELSAGSTGIVGTTATEPLTALILFAGNYYYKTSPTRERRELTTRGFHPDDPEDV